MSDLTYNVDSIDICVNGKVERYVKERTGKWIEGGIWYQTHYLCSECGKEVSNLSNYCPDCGAKMEGEEE